MIALVLVGMSITEAREREQLQRLADDAGATLAFLQHGEPSLVRELDRLAITGVEQVTLQPVALGPRSPARSWLRRVAGHWVRAGSDRPEVVVADRAVTGSEAPLRSSAWEDVPRHRHHVLVCRGPRCAAQGADEVSDELGRALGAAGLDDDDVLVAQTGCLFPCNHAPVVVVHPDDAWFGPVRPSSVAALVNSFTDSAAALPVGLPRLPRHRNPVRVRSGSATVSAEQASQTLDADPSTKRGENPEEIP